MYGFTFVSAIRLGKESIGWRMNVGDTSVDGEVNS